MTSLVLLRSDESTIRILLAYSATDPIIIKSRNPNITHRENIISSMKVTYERNVESVDVMNSRASSDIHVIIIIIISSSSSTR